MSISSLKWIKVCCFIKNVKRIVMRALLIFLVFYVERWFINTFVLWEDVGGICNRKGEHLLINITEMEECKQFDEQNSSIK